MDDAVIDKDECVAELYSQLKSWGDVGVTSIYGVPFEGDQERLQVVLHKFLRARDWNVEASAKLLKESLLWRGEEGVDELAEGDESFGPDFDAHSSIFLADKSGGFIAAPHAHEPTLVIVKIICIDTNSMFSQGDPL